MSAFPQTHISVKDGKVNVLRTHDAEPIVEANKEAQKDPGRGFWKNKAARRIGTIPPVLFERFLKEEFGAALVKMKPMERHRAIMKMLHKKLRDPDWRWLRTVDKI